MNLVVFAHQDLSDVPIHKWVDCKKNRVFVMADVEEQKNDDVERFLELGYAEVKLYSNYVNNGNIEADVIELFERHHLDRLIAIGEGDVVRTARLREALGIPGQSLESAVAYRNKSVMKRFLVESQVPVAPHRTLSSPIDLVEFRRAQGLPLFIKPAAASNSTALHAIRTEAEYQRFLTQGFGARFPYSDYPGDLMVEKLIEGRQYHVDGLVLEGTPEVIVPSLYLTPFMPKCSVTVETEDPLHGRLCTIVSNALKALPSPRAFSFHAEVFHTPNDELLINEIASRTGGGKISSVVGVMCGVELNHLSVLGQIDPAVARQILSEYRSLSQCAGISLISPKDVELIAAPNQCPLPWVLDFNVYAPIGFKTNPGTPSKIAAGVVKGDNAVEVKARLNQFNHWFLESFTRSIER